MEANKRTSVYQPAFMCAGSIIFHPGTSEEWLQLRGQPPLLPVSGAIQACQLTDVWAVSPQHHQFSPSATPVQSVTHSPMFAQALVWVSPAISASPPILLFFSKTQETLKWSSLRF